MRKNNELHEMLSRAGNIFLPGLSIDCVIFGFHDNELKVLLLKMLHRKEWALPGGFIYKEETIEAAAIRVLKERTGLDDIFLRQFHTFGDPRRSGKNTRRAILRKQGIPDHMQDFLLQRFVTIGFYALVEFSNVYPQPDSLSEACAWCDIKKIPALMLDHKNILDAGLQTLRQQLNEQPVGYNLLPEKFTMPELQKLYETILGKKLDRRNFQRRMIGYGILRRLKERRKGGAHKSPFLYSFDLRRYRKALELGWQGGW